MLGKVTCALKVCREKQENVWVEAKIQAGRDRFPQKKSPRGLVAEEVWVGLSSKILHPKDFSYTPPRNCTTIEQWKCEDKPLIEKELKKQNNLLNYLHQQISGSLPDQDVSAVEERLWQVQTAITALKRRLKAVAEPTTAQAPGEMEEKPCVEMYEEKQLMAVQASLRNDISDEKKRIALLLYKMEIFEKEHGEPETFTVEIQESGQEEETKRKALISELDQLRTECALIRAKIEMATQSAMISTRF